MTEANRFLLIYNPGFDFAHYVLYTIEKKSKYKMNTKHLDTKY